MFSSRAASIASRMYSTTAPSAAKVAVLGGEAVEFHSRRGPWFFILWWILLRSSRLAVGGGCGCTAALVIVVVPPAMVVSVFFSSTPTQLPQDMQEGVGLHPVGGNGFPRAELPAPVHELDSAKLLGVAWHCPQVGELLQNLVRCRCRRHFQ